MKKEIIYSMKSPYRDEFRIVGYRFGEGKKTVAIIGAMRGDEIQQQYVASQLVNRLQHLEENLLLAPDCELLVIPTINHYSLNIGKRFWSLDNTDINRMFPGYDKGETTQRIAAAVFEAIKDYEYGIQLASFYIPGDFIPHVRMLNTGYEDINAARMFGLPYICMRKPTPYDTTLLNYNWQVWETKAFSIYAGRRNEIVKEDTRMLQRSILRFLGKIGAVQYKDSHAAYYSDVIDERELIALKAEAGGLFYAYKTASDEVKRGEKLGVITDGLDGSILKTIYSPMDGIVFFVHNSPLACQESTLFRIYGR